MADMVYGEDDGKEKDDEEEEETGEEEVDNEEVGEGAVEEYVVKEEEIQELMNNKENSEEEEEEEKEEEEVLDKDVCRHCHQRGHKERKCPVLHPELVKQPRMKEKKNVTELAIRDKVRIELG